MWLACCKTWVVSGIVLFPSSLKRKPGSKATREVRSTQRLAAGNLRWGCLRDVNANSIYSLASHKHVCKWSMYPSKSHPLNCCNQKPIKSF